MSSICPGSRVSLHYRLILEDGFIADRTEEGEPLEFVLGDGTLEAGLEQLLLGLEAGMRREFTVQPGTVFPFPGKAAVQFLERQAFPPGARLEPGMIYQFDTPAGDAIAGRILSLQEETVCVDFNHPLAGQRFRFVVDIGTVVPGGAAAGETS